MARQTRVDLDRFLSDKLVDWYGDSGELETDQLRVACRLMTHFLSNVPSDEIVSAKSPTAAVAQFKYALDNPTAWATLEKELNDLSQADLDARQFPDLVHSLTLL